jgi:hypothetical protein
VAKQNTTAALPDDPLPPQVVSPFHFGALRPALSVATQSMVSAHYCNDSTALLFTALCCSFQRKNSTG